MHPWRGPLPSQHSPRVTGAAQDGPGSADLAQELSNPIADLITVPIQFNLDQNIGPMDT